MVMEVIVTMLNCLFGLFVAKFQSSQQRDSDRYADLLNQIYASGHSLPVSTLEALERDAWR